MKNHLLLPAAALICAAAHRVLLAREAGHLQPPGRRVLADGCVLHVFQAGTHRDSPQLVLLSGAAVPAPVYAYQPLWQHLSQTHTVWVVERAGYGYADHTSQPRDLDTVLGQTRTALHRAGAVGPFLLLAHSMGGLEALYWAQTHPDEVAAIVGLDMATPFAYTRLRTPILRARALAALSTCGLSRVLPADLPDGLSPAETHQARLLLRRNLGGPCLVAEAKWLRANCQKIQPLTSFSQPFLLFSSDGRQIGPFWLPAQRVLAAQTGAQWIVLDCGHDLHLRYAHEISLRISVFAASCRAHVCQNTYQPNV